MLDATDPLLPFGMLPLTCLNDKGRVFSLDKPSYWMDLNLPQRESSTYTRGLSTGGWKIKERNLSPLCLQDTALMKSARL